VAGVEHLRVLVTVKTYPTPSVSHMETVCTGGITEDGRWIRLYPVPFRYLQQRQQYRLYDWIELPARKRPPEQDRRKESYEPAGDLQVVGHVGTEDNWGERKRLILPHAARSIEHLLAGYEREGESLGIIKPASVSDVKVERDEEEWSPAHLALFQQLRLFGPRQKRLERVRHRFRYCFRCDDITCTGHTLQIVDWGLCYLYIKTLQDEGEATAVRKTTEKCVELIAEGKDTHLYVGTRYPYPSFMVLGIFYPRKERGGEKAAGTEG
jgi:hypothetical protein